MDFTLLFIEVFFTSLVYTAPLFITLALGIVILGRVVGFIEGWSWLDSIYYAFITATTVGYGDFSPKHSVSKVLAILITFKGMVFTGIMVAVALQTAGKAFDASPHYHELLEKIERIEKAYGETP